MKEAIRFMLSLLLSLVAMVCNAYDFEVDGLFYNVLSIPDLTCEVTHKGKYSNCYSGDVTIPETVTYNGRTFAVIGVGYEAFYDCDSLTSVSMPAVKSIGEEAFSSCSSLSSVSMPSVTTIGLKAFWCDRSLTSIYLPSTLLLIEPEAFRECGLKEVILAPGEDELSFVSTGLARWFSGCPLKKLSVNRPMVYAKDYYGSKMYPFEGLHLDNLTITKTFTDDTFSADTVYSYVDSAYVGWNAKVVTLGHTTQELTAFPTTVESLTLECAAPPSVTSDMFTNSQYMYMVVTVPAGSLAAYQTADVWKNFWCLQESGIEHVLPDSTAGVFRVYNLQGVLVLTTEDAEAVNRLPKGLYIVNGKKTAIK